MKFCVPLLVAISVASPAWADAITLPAEGYEEAEEIGGIELLSVVRSPDDVECSEDIAPPCSLAALIASGFLARTPDGAYVRRSPSPISVEKVASLVSQIPGATT